MLLALLALALPPGAQAKPGPQRSACQRLDANHRDLSPHKRLVLVERGDPDFGDISSCLLPRGRVRKLASWDDGLGRATVELVATRGLFVVIRDAWADQYGGVSEWLGRVSARTGASDRLAGYGCFTEFYNVPCTEGTSWDDVALAATGAGAVELTHLETGAAELQAFAPDGAVTHLDDGPVDDLHVSGADIVWTRDGTERRAPLPTR